MKKKLFCKVFMFFLFLSFCWLGNYTESSAYTREDIGLYPGNKTPGDFVPGIEVYCDGKLLGYAFDVWNYSTSEGWKYLSSNVDGTTFTSKYYENNSSVVWFRSGAENTSRFYIVISNLKKKLENRNYSIVIQKHYLGRTNFQIKVETPYSTDAELDPLFSLQRHLNAGDDYAGCGSFSGECPSYVYHLYTMPKIGPESEIRTGGKEYLINQTGEAYYNGSNYIIQSLPEVTPQIEGYQCSLQGWYDAPEGGKQYKPGDVIQKSTVLYPHWNKVPNKYTVKCIDVIGNNSFGQKLGESYWEQEYDSIAYGSNAGCIPLESMYYNGMIYTGCSEATVKLSDTTVYRYFDYAEYAVQIKDQISGGSNTGELLGNTSQWHAYGTVVNGDILGNSTEEGAYYPGYYFIHSTSDIVGRNGIVVYRYFRPIQYHICLDGNGASDGAMADIRDCWYQENYELTANSYSKEINIHLDLQAKEAICDTDSLMAKQNFLGWAESSDGSVRYSDRANVKNLRDTSGSCTLYAVWESANVTIKAQPKRMGYQFVGWSANPDALSGKTEFSLKEDTTLYAIWKADVVPYHIEYYKETMQGTYEKTANYQLSNYTGTKVSVQDSIPTYPGFYLDSKSSVLEGTVSGDGSLVLIVYYRRNTYRVTFEDTTLGTEELADLELSGIFEAEVQIPEYSARKEGYYFAGWTADPETGQIYCKAGDTYRIPNHDQKLYAVWKPNSYKVKFDVNVSEEEADQIEGNMDTVTGYYGESLLLPDCAWKRKGYSFDSWNTKADGSGDSYQGTEEIDSLYDENTRSVTLYAIWQPINGTIEYQANIPEICSGVLKGTMSNIDFQYEQFIELPECSYQLSGYQFVEWNTKADGSGQGYLPGNHVKNIFSSEEDNVLYAIWKARDDTRFILRLEKEALDGSIDTETMIYSGTTDMKLSEAVVAYYAELGQEVDPTNFISGYQVTNPEVLEENRINANGESNVSLKLIRKEFSLKILRDALDPEKEIYFCDSAKYEMMYILPEEIPGIGKIARYIDEKGNIYQSGEGICIDHDINLMAQHQLIYDLDSEQEEEYVFHNMPYVLQKPQETVYSFEGWYSDSRLHDYVGTDGSIVYFQKDTVLYAKWSEEKISYSIGYQFNDGNEIVLLGEVIKTYHSGERVLLPTASQVVVPEGYQFVGWYESGDETQTICTEISEDQYGNKIYYLKLKMTDVKNPQETEEASALPSISPSAPPSISPSESPSIPPSASPSIPPSESPSILPPESPSISPSESPLVSEKPEETKIPEETARPNESGTKSDQNIVLSPSSNSNQSVDDKLDTAVLKKESNQKFVDEYTKAGIKYQLISRKKRTLRVIRVKSAKKTVSIPKTVDIGGIKYKVTEIGSKAFCTCKKTQIVKLGANVKKIRKKAFYGMKKLKKIVICRKKEVKFEKSILPVSGKQIRIVVPKVKKKSYQKALKKGGYFNAYVIEK